ncbi:MAG: glycosyltransferase family 4 protein [Chthonomonadaceae bacterium]|nr:glycosyltransferase family 4 protein [Chthonomonadaceae bacterium]
MRIAVWYNLHSGGGKRALSHQIRGLLAQGHTVDLWSPPLPDKEAMALSPEAKAHVVPLDYDAGVRANPLSRLSAKNRQIYRCFAAVDAHCRQCATEIEGGNYDLLLAHPCYLTAAPPIGRYVNLPSLIYLQEPNRGLYEASEHSPWRAAEPALPRSPGQFLRQWQEKARVADCRMLVREEHKSVSAFDKILVNSFFSRESMRRAYDLDSKVCYLGIDAENFLHRQLPRENFVVGLGAFVPAKNQAFVIEALARVPEPRPKLVWIGNITLDPAYLEELKRLAESLHVEFEVRKMISDRDLVDLLNRASMMLSASRLEPFGYAPLEANACGTPVIAVAEGGVRETVIDGENGLLVENDPQEMAAAIIRLRDDPAFARRLGENARRIVESKWNLEAAADRLEQCLQSVTTRRQEKRIADPVSVL